MQRFVRGGFGIGRHIHIAQHQMQLTMNITPFSHPHIRQIILTTPLAQLILT